MHAQGSEGDRIDAAGCGAFSYDDRLLAAATHVEADRPNAINRIGPSVRVLHKNPVGKVFVCIFNRQPVHPPYAVRGTNGNHRNGYCK